MGSYAYELRFDSGRICLDLVATGVHPVEQLDCGERLAAWLTGAGLLPPDTTLPADPAWLSGFIELREYVRQLVRAEIADRPADTALDRVNAYASGSPPALKAVRLPDGTLVKSFANAPHRDALLAVVARDTVDLLTDPAARALLRQCEGDSCARLYLDTSRGRRRRWCSSEVCGNRERVARHRRRAAVGARA
ncbi:CGNR zinc finger domain-containing protein [Streptomyces sp. NBC_01465]|uniref:CGNR zinc finger domain-containing protein n=1 Tax=Streptomyces sp. NBC_01465 TaxID=2903878 RepID=UPI002E381527|nr:ABATE domain-containing protein [Streptomyces sp. NBC_01465]